MNAKYFTWDLVVRITHWVVAIGCILNFLIIRPGSIPHQVIGYIVFIFVLIRLIWMFTGAKSPARLRDMLPTIAGMKAHIEDLKAGEHRGVGHNSFGLLFIWAAWGLLVAIVITGYFAAIAAESGSIVPELNEAVFELAYDYDFKELHEVLVTILEGLVVFHVLAVFITGKLLKHNYLRSMIHKSSMRDKN